MNPQAALPPERVREELERVLARAEFHEQESLLRQLLEWLGARFGAEGANALVGVLVALLLAALLAWLLSSLRRTLRARRGLAAHDAPLAAAPSLEQRLLRLKEAAERARAAGDSRLALRLLFEALLAALGGRGDLEFRPAWTNRELVRRGKLAPGARALLDPLVRELEPKEFGSARIEPDDLARLDALLAPHLTRRVARGEGTP